MCIADPKCQSAAVVSLGADSGVRGLSFYLFVRVRTHMSDA